MMADKSITLRTIYMGIKVILGHEYAKLNFARRPIFSGFVL
jgi:hypothetical protein